MEIGCGSFIIWFGILIGILDIVIDILYYIKTDFANQSLKIGCIVFIIILPIWYMFIYIVYVASNTDIDTKKERAIKIILAPLYGILLFSKVLPGFERI